MRIGAYKPGSDPELDQALGSRKALRAFATQDIQEHSQLAESLRRLATLAGEV